MHLSDPAISCFSNDNIINLGEKMEREKEGHAINIFEDC